MTTILKKNYILTLPYFLLFFLFQISYNITYVYKLCLVSNDELNIYMLKLK